MNLDAVMKELAEEAAEWERLELEPALEPLKDPVAPAAIGSVASVVLGAALGWYCACCAAGWVLGVPFHFV